MALAGTPCVVFPIGTTWEDLSIGVQVHARRWADERLRDVADAREQVLAVDAAPVEGLG
jgi:Asp-tRNA(Asn)/Glu-tRNA(Gln) amidotransferase A subunit family amidase